MDEDLKLRGRAESTRETYVRFPRQVDDERVAWIIKLRVRPAGPEEAAPTGSHHIGPLEELRTVRRRKHRETLRGRDGHEAPVRREDRLARGRLAGMNGPFAPPKI